MHFVDDKIILAEDAGNIHYMLWKIDKKYIKWGLTFNSLQTEYAVVGNVGDSLQLQDTKIKNSNSYRYLGVQITDDCRNAV